MHIAIKQIFFKPTMEPPKYKDIQYSRLDQDSNSQSAPRYEALMGEPILIEYEENARIHRIGFGRAIWNCYACCGLVYNILYIILTVYRMFWTLFGCFCCIFPLIFIFCLLI